MGVLLATWLITVDLICRHQSGLRSSSSTTELEVSLTRTMFGNQSFAIDGPRVWNSLPAFIHDLTLTLTVFTNGLKIHLFEQ